MVLPEHVQREERVSANERGRPVVEVARNGWGHEKTLRQDGGRVDVILAAEAHISLLVGASGLPHL